MRSGTAEEAFLFVNGTVKRGFPAIVAPHVIF
jgi:hypothetical protein